MQTTLYTLLFPDDRTLSVRVSFRRAAQGCRVFAFDPTVNHSTAPNAWHRNVTFRPWGLRSKTSASNYQTEVNKLGQYGSVFGELISLREIMTRLGHPLDSLITAFKLDCEGDPDQTQGSLTPLCLLLPVCLESWPRATPDLPHPAC